MANAFARAALAIAGNADLAQAGFITPAGSAASFAVRVILAEADAFATVQGLSVTRRDTLGSVLIADYPDNPTGGDLTIGARTWRILDARQDVEVTSWQMDLRNAD